MLLELKDLVQKYDLDLKTVLHVGAHKAEEHDDYFDSGADKVHWVEGNEELALSISRKLDLNKNQISLAIVSSEDNQPTKFRVTNNGASSSILKLKEHLVKHPGIKEIRSEDRKTITIDTLMDESIIGKNEPIDMLNLDIQGAELLALRGAKQTLKRVKCILTEVNELELYEGCVLINELDQFLKEHGFKRVEKAMWQDCGWGDAFYIR
tara:strand:- start:813 stop:1439 length:627 start_codon:yes stop_codon:yes gene_type:complete